MWTFFKGGGGCYIVTNEAVRYKLCAWRSEVVCSTLWELMQNEKPREACKLHFNSWSHYDTKRSTIQNCGFLLYLYDRLQGKTKHNNKIFFIASCARGIYSGDVFMRMLKAIFGSSFVCFIYPQEPLNVFQSMFHLHILPHDQLQFVTLD